jgi:hypothetical protein
MKRVIIVAIMLICGLSLVPQAFAQGTGPRRPAIAGGVSDKPFMKNFGGGIALGGYIGHELLVGEGFSTFDQHRFIPFIYAEPVEFIHVAAEIEFEHGGLVKSGKSSGVDTNGDGNINEVTNSTTDGEIKLEYATIDWIWSDAVNVRAGVILSPLGKFNLVHDSPLNDLTNRPLVVRALIPSTLSESGMGLFGVFYPGEWVVGYEMYAVNGFNLGVLDSDGRLRVRGGRGSQKKDNNENKAFVGRLSASPLLGVDIGLSGHTGSYDAIGDYNLTIGAVDLDIQRGPLQLLGEAALVSAETDRDASPDAAQHQAGFYAQANFHFGFGVIKRYTEGAFTGVLRLDRVDFDTRMAGDDQQLVTLGLNFRPVEGTVAKVDYRWDWKRSAGETVWSVPDNLLSISLATYF